MRIAHPHPTNTGTTLAVSVWGRHASFQTWHLDGMMSTSTPSVATSNPRKFAEKIALHNQKGAEETAEFTKIMAECAAVMATRVRTTASLRS